LWSGKKDRNEGRKEKEWENRVGKKIGKGVFVDGLPKTKTPPTKNPPKTKNKPGAKRKKEMPGMGQGGKRTR